jgi:lipopolysaccharide/colanic/teichoic acid biosynthesis glycosyltransferase
VAGDRLLLVGDGPLLDDLAGYLELHPQLGIHVAGRIRETGSAALPLDLTGMMQTFESNGIVVGMPDSRLASELLELRFLGLSIQEAAGTYAKICNRESLVGLTPTRLLSSGEFEPSPRSLFFRAVIDKLLAAACLIVLSPLMLLLAGLVRLCFNGTVLERRIRGGRNGAPFTLYSFRVTSTEGISSGARQARLGRLLTRTGLYALPQLFNVLCGQMSLVGPKPHGLEFMRELTGYIPVYPQRFKVTPGITGWSQIQMRHDSGPPDCMVELEYDLYYIKQVAPMMNIFVILQSIKNIMLWGGRP